jgi:hypothetical protein
VHLRLLLNGTNSDCNVRTVNPEDVAYPSLGNADHRDPSLLLADLAGKEKGRIANHEAAQSRSFRRMEVAIVRPVQFNP